jgi:hypothetical protein
LSIHHQYYTYNTHDIVKIRMPVINTNYFNNYNKQTFITIEEMPVSKFLFRKASMHLKLNNMDMVQFNDWWGALLNTYDVSTYNVHKKYMEDIVIAQNTKYVVYAAHKNGMKKFTRLINDLTASKDRTAMKLILKELISLNFIGTRIMTEFAELLVNKLLQDNEWCATNIGVTVNQLHKMNTKLMMIQFEEPLVMRLN